MEQTNANTAPLEIHNLAELVTQHEKSYANSIEAFRDELLRIITEDNKIILPPQDKYGEINPYKAVNEDFVNSVEFQILLDRALYRLGFIISKKGLVYPVLYVAPSWRASWFWEIKDKEAPDGFCKKVIMWHTASKMYSLMDEILSYLNQ